MGIMKTVLFAKATSDAEIKEFVQLPFLKVVFGMRGCGHRAFFERVKNSIVESAYQLDVESDIEERIVTLDFAEIPHDFDFSGFVDKTVVGGKRFHFFLFDVQRAKDWERVLEFLSIKNVDVYVAGTNLSIEEGLKRVGSRAKKFELFSEIDAEQKRGILSSALIFDVAIVNSVKNMELLENIISVIQSTVSKPMSSADISKILKSRYGKGADEATILSYIGFLENAFILKKINGMNIKKRTKLESVKYYFTSPHLIFSASEDDERVVQNKLLLKFIEKGVQTNFAQSVDFVVNVAKKTYFIQASAKVFSEDDYEKKAMPLRQIEVRGEKLMISTNTFATEDEDELKHFSLDGFLESF